MTRPGRHADHARRRRCGKPTPGSSSRNWPKRSIRGCRRRRTRSTRWADWSSCSPATSRPRASASSIRRAGGSKRSIPTRAGSSASGSTRRKRTAGRLVLREQLAGSAIALNSSALPAGIEQEHRRLLARLAFEADGRRDHELDARVARAVRPAPSSRPSAAPARNAAPAHPRRRPHWSRAGRDASGARWATI